MEGLHANKDDKWVVVQPIPYALVIDIGNLLEVKSLWLNSRNPNSSGNQLVKFKKHVILMFIWLNSRNPNSEVYEIYIDIGDDKWEIQEQTS